MSSVSLQNSTKPATPEWLPLVQGKVESLRFGVVQIVVHDHQVTQIERTEKTRFDSPKAEPFRTTTSI